jgi:hypothetical protein
MFDDSDNDDSDDLLSEFDKCVCHDFAKCNVQESDHNNFQIHTFSTFAMFSTHITTSCM